MCAAYVRAPGGGVIVTRLFWNSRPPRLLERSARKLGRDRAQSGHYPWARESPGHAVRPREDTLPRRDSRDGGQGTWTWPRETNVDKLVSEPGNGEWALETRLAEQPCRSNCQGNAKIGEEVRGKRIEDFEVGV